jgi:hypothetical protein
MSLAVDLKLKGIAEKMQWKCYVNPFCFACMSVFDVVLFILIRAQCVM